VVLLHDPLLEAGTTLSGWAHERTAAAIRSGRLLGSGGEATVERPLLLEELLERTPPGVTVQLEAKAYMDPDLARRTAIAICERLRDHPRRGRAEVISFWPAACEAAAALGFSARLVVIAGHGVRELAVWARRTGVQGVCLEHFLLTPAVVATLRGAGLSVTTGTVNHGTMLAPLLALALDAVTTDAPHELRAAYAQALPLAA
jgi:glycerophosphoryl diester phosphodiesterase